MAAEPFLAMVIPWGGNYAPRGWAFCDGQLLPINQNQSLFALLGTNFGGDGRTTFGLPDLRGRHPMHPGDGPGRTPRLLGAKGGAERHTLVLGELGGHTHGVEVGPAPGLRDPQGNSLGPNAVSLHTATAVMSPDAVGEAGGSQWHENMPPFIALDYIIATQGLFPSRN